jgi:hypothetical protein
VGIRSPHCFIGEPQSVLIPGITVKKVVVTDSINCTCDGTLFQFNVTNVSNNIDLGTEFYCDGGSYSFAGPNITTGVIYTVTEIVPSGWILDDINCQSSEPGYDCITNEEEAKATTTLREGEEVNITFTDIKCAWADAGPDKITCAGDNVTLWGNASCFSRVNWTMDQSCVVGDLKTPLNGDYNNSEYVPQNPLSVDGVTCKLYFNATGACGVYSSNMTVNVVEEPIADIEVDS